MGKCEKKPRAGKKNKKPMGKKLYSIVEIYDIAVKAFRSAKDMKKGVKNNLLDEKLKERVMLAVTSVNKCAMCSYVHTGMALKAGLSNEEIQSFVAGDFPDLPLSEVKAVLFAQHYADSRGKPDKASWEEIVKEYGSDKAKSILAATRIIMMGNAMGIAVNSVKGRFKGEGADPRSSVAYEAAFFLTIIPITLIALIQVLLLDLFRVPVISFGR